MVISHHQRIDTKRQTAICPVLELNTQRLFFQNKIITYITHEKNASNSISTNILTFLYFKMDKMEGHALYMGHAYKIFVREPYEKRSVET
jgi:hypothetical protein